MPKSNHKESRLIFINEELIYNFKVFNQLLKLIPEIKTYSKFRTY